VVKESSDSCVELEQAATAGLQAYHGKTAAEHQALFDQFFKTGFMPINVSVVSQHGNRTYAAFHLRRFL
jgi:hypothetical protein